MDWIWTFFDWAATSFLIVSAWAVGEAGRTYIAGAAGGAYSWINSPTRSLRDGSIAIVGGIGSAIFLTPLTIALLGLISIDLGDSPAAISTYNFLSGVFGMSTMKIVVGLVEAELALRTRRAEQEARDD